MCEATKSEDCRVKVAALQCLVKMMTLHFHYMEMEINDKCRYLCISVDTYMGTKVRDITLDAIKHKTDEVALLGIEFWYIHLQSNILPSRILRFYGIYALKLLVPRLMVRLTDESDDGDDWNPCKAAGECLRLLATYCPESG